MKTSASPLTWQIAEWSKHLRYSEAPDDVREALLTCVLYNLTMAVSVDASNDELGRTVKVVATEHGRSRVLTGGPRLTARDAAFVNAGLVTARGQNDTHPGTVTHIGCVVIPAVMALADEVGASTDEVLSAILSGYEAIPRIAHGISTLSSERGFRPTPIYAGIGATVATAKLLRLSTEKIAHAISIATQFAAGTMQTWEDGSDEWRLQVARTSRNAVEAALLARAGLTGSPHALEGSGGFVRAYSGGTLSMDTSGWRILEMKFKPYPGCAFNQAPVHALRQCLAGAKLRAADISRVVVQMNPADAAYPGVTAYGPFGSRAGAIMSLPFMLAVTLRDGLPKLRHFNQEFGCGDIHTRSQMVDIRSNDHMPRWHCIVEVVCHNGSIHRIDVNPEVSFSFGWDEIVNLVQGVVSEWPTADPQHQFQSLVKNLSNLHSQADYEELASAVFNVNRTGEPD